MPDISKWNTKNANSMREMFSNCFSLISLPDINKWNINKVEDNKNIFEDCLALIFLPNIKQIFSKN